MDINWFSADYLPWLILFFPLLSFAIIVLFTTHNRRNSQIVALTGIGLAWLFSMIEFVNTVWVKDNLGEKVFGSQLTWLEVGARTLKMGVMVDPLTAYMLLMVPLACLLIFIYSMGYMHHDPHNSRFFAYISLFAGAMLTLVVADNLLMLFIGWEVMGLCSYLLIGFWFHKKSAYQAGVKAFMTTRVGDVLMLVGIGYLFALTGTLNFRDILYNEEVLKELAHTDSVLFGGSAAALIGVLLVMGTIGKSSQFPLQVWLPDAMEGPTPVSAMIHAATMVSAGVYMVIRMFPLLSAGHTPHTGDFSSPMILMGVVGSITALGAAILGMGQNDIKRVLAYSTISQLGFMVAALGIGAWTAAAFHLINHAFFKALLFMASGVVIHSMEHGEHHVHEHSHDEHHDEAQALPDGLVMDYVAPPNNIQRMGGLIHRIPVTAITMAIGGLSLAGFPFLTAGFWSKDEIIADAWHGMSQSNLPMFVFLALITAAILTAFYTARMWLMTFWGEARTVEAEHAGTGMLRNRWVNVWNRTRMGQEKPLEPEETDREADVVAMQMEIPLIILAFFAIFAGFIFPVLPDFLNKTLLEEPPEIDFNILPMLLSIIAALGGLFLGYFVYGMRPVRADEVDPLERSLGPGLWHALQMRFGMDLFYRRYVVGPFQWLASGKYFRRSAKLYAEAIVSTELLAKPDTAELAKTNATIQPGTRYPVLSWTRSRDWVRLDVKGKKDEFWVPTSSVTLIDEAGMVQDLSNYTISFVDALDKEVFDGTLHSIADAFIWLGEFFKRFNTVVIDGVGDGIPRAILDGARWFRQIQSGRIQQYLLIVALALLAIGTLFLLQVM